MKMYIDLLLNAKMLERVLQELEIIDEVDLLDGVPFDPMQGHFIGVGCIQKMTVNAA
jgi:hypothetical protein